MTSLERISALLLIVTGLTLAAPNSNASQRWISYDIYHMSRALPVFDTFSRLPLNPGIQVGYHTNHWGDGSLTYGASLQTGYAQFDRLFWAVHAGGGINANWTPLPGALAQYGIRVDYERIFTGNNNFILKNGRYQQQVDNGRSILRVTPLDVSLGYAPPFLRNAGMMPALRFAWAIDVPLYSGDEPGVWSYTQLGLSLLWKIGGQQ